jgi:hypothetical protein
VVVLAIKIFLTLMAIAITKKHLEEGAKRGGKNQPPAYVLFFS